MTVLRILGRHHILFLGRNWINSNLVLPDYMILTRDEVNQMVASGEIGGKADMYPADGLIYDGTEKPGTPFQLSVNCQRSLHNFVEEKSHRKRILSLRQLVPARLNIEKYAVNAVYPETNTIRTERQRSIKVSVSLLENKGGR